MSERKQDPTQPKPGEVYRIKRVHDNFVGLSVFDEESDHQMHLRLVVERGEVIGTVHDNSSEKANSSEVEGV